MNLEIKGKNIDIGESLRTYSQEMIDDVLAKYFGDANSGHLTITKDGAMFRTEIQLHVNKRTIVEASGKNIDARSSVEEAIEHVAKRLRRHKRKLKSHSQAQKDMRFDVAASYVLPAFNYEEEEPEDNIQEDNPVIIAESTTEIEELTVSQAAMRMDLLGINALLFKNAAHGELNMVYLRKDGNIAWVDPTKG